MSAGSATCSPRSGSGLISPAAPATGATTDLAYVSPRTGRAVSRAAGLPYHDKLLPLPDFLWRDAPADEPQIALGLALTGYFLLHHVLAPHGRTLPAARERLAERLRRRRRLVQCRRHVAKVRPIMASRLRPVHARGLTASD